LCMGWLRLVGSLKLQVSFAKEPYKRDYVLQKRPIIFKASTHRSHPIPCTCAQVHTSIYEVLFSVYLCAVYMCIHVAGTCYMTRHTALRDVDAQYITYCNTLHHTATHCNKLQHTATHCTSLHHAVDAQSITFKSLAHTTRHTTRHTT